MPPPSTGETNRQDSRFGRRLATPEGRGPWMGRVTRREQAASGASFSLVPCLLDEQRKNRRERFFAPAPKG